jgi:hypothetical protein
VPSRLDHHSVSEHPTAAGAEPRVCGGQTAQCGSVQAGAKQSEQLIRGSAMELQRILDGGGEIHQGQSGEMGTGLVDARPQEVVESG